MTIKKRLFISNTLMLIIPALVSILIILISMFLFMNLFYKQFMDETVKENNLSYIHELLVEQSKEFLDSNEDITDSKLYHTIEKYLSSQEMKLDIYDDTGIVCTIGSSNKSQTEAVLISAIESLGGEGNISMNGSCLYGEKILVNGETYHVLIYSSSEIQESQYNEFLVKNIIVILCIMIIAAVIVTNRFLTKFVFRKIEAPLDILTDGVHQIRDGNLDYRITYNEQDEFQSVCEDFNDMAVRLGLGADDYIVKPFSPGELVARVQAHIATYNRLKGGIQEIQPEITVGAIRINPKSHRVFVKEKEISLKNKEYELLLFLVTNADMVFDKETLYERIWGMDSVGDNATVAVHINRLREKIEDDPSDPHYIETVWGAGYRFRA